MRNFQKIKELSDYEKLDAPLPVHGISDVLDSYLLPPSIMILRMLVHPKYGEWKIPNSLSFLEKHIKQLWEWDAQNTGIYDSWCYVTVRHGEVTSRTDDEWHFDGSSFRTDIIPERNYVWVNHSPTEYKVGELFIPDDLDPIKHNLFTFAAKQLENAPVQTTIENQWYLLSPYVLHRRPHVLNPAFKSRTFVRVCFTDIEGRDVNNTHNPLLPTPFFGRNPVQSFRNNLKHYYSQK
jgi:hypothetical protein